LKQGRVARPVKSRIFTFAGASRAAARSTSLFDERARSLPEMGRMLYPE
jgi:hypothetical protein